MRLAGQVKPAAQKIAINSPAESTKQKPVMTVKEDKPIPVKDVETTTSTALPPIGITLGSLKHVKDAARNRILADQNKAAAIVVSDENVSLAWSELIEIIAGDKMVYKNALKNSKLVIEGEAIHIQADVVSIDFLKTERIRILDFFKLKYQNERINVLFEVALNDVERSGEQVMSAREVFEAMAERNPNLKLLKDRLGLDMEY